jgi:hypothetical protein
MVTISKMAMKSGQSRVNMLCNYILKEDTIKYAYGNGFFLGIFIVCLILTNLLFLVLLMKSIFLAENEEENF